jgi:putative DNA primase/helicase
MEAFDETLGAIIDYFESVLGQHIDGKCRTPNQIFFTPSCPPDAEGTYRIIHLPGTPLHTADFKVSYPDREALKKLAAEPSRGGRPGDDYNLRVTVNAVVSLLQAIDWKISHRGRDGEVHMTRPGKNVGASGTVGFKGTKLFQCHSSDPAVAPFKGGGTYDPFAVFTLTRYGGDFSASARELAEQGPIRNPSPAEESGLHGDSERLEWLEPSPLPEGLPPVKSLEPEMLPEPLRGWLMDIADRMQIPPDFSAAAAVVALGSIIGRGCGINPKRRDDWLVVPNLWGSVVGRPALMKTPAISESQKHLIRLETEERESYQEAARAFELEKEVRKITKSALGEEIKKAVKKGKPDDIEQARARLADLQTDGPIRRRYQTQDGTTEKIGELLIENPRGLLVNRDELIGWFRSLDRDGREGDRSFYLEAWNGNRGFTYDRIGRGTLDIPALCMSVFGAMTPGPLASYVYQANSGGRGDDGLLQRFQVIVWPDAQGEWENIDRYPDTTEKNRVWEIFKALSGDIPGAVREEGAAIPSLRFTPAGQEVFDTWRLELETRLRGDHGLHPAMESHLTKYRKLMPSLALIFHLVAVADGATPGPVSEVSAVLAAAWCQYLESHATRIYGAATMPGIEAAREIVKHIRRGAISEGCTPKKIYRNQWSRLTSPEEVKAGLEVLAGYDWLTLQKITTGGRPSEIIRLNPLIKL